MNRATNVMRDSAAELVSRRCGDGSAARMRGGEHRNFLSSSAGRRVPFRWIAAQIDWSLGSRDGQPARIGIVGLKNHCSHRLNPRVACIRSIRLFDAVVPMAAIGAERNHTICRWTSALRSRAVTRPAAIGWQGLPLLRHSLPATVSVKRVETGRSRSSFRRCQEARGGAW